MGQKLSFQTFEDCPGPENVDFFKSIQTRWLDFFCDRLLERSFPKLDIEDPKLVVKWNDYFSIFSQIVELKKTETRAKERSSWHISCDGYEMVTQASSYSVTPNVPRTFTDPELLAGHTDDEPEPQSEGEESDDESDEEGETDADSGEEEEEEGEGEVKDAKAEGKDGEGEDGDEEGGESKKKKKKKKKKKGEEKETEGDVDDEAAVIADGDAPPADTDAVVAVSDDDGSQADGKGGKGKKGKEEVKEAVNPRDQLVKDQRDLIIDKAKEAKVPEATLKPGQLPDGWDSNVISPIFFGYTRLKTHDREEKEAKEKAEIEVRERSAVNQAEKIRGSLLVEFEEAINRRMKQREERIVDLKKDYTGRRTEREKDLMINSKDLPEVAFKTYKRQWDREYKASEESFNAELGRLEEIHDRKSTHDRMVLLGKKQDLEAFKDAEKQLIPSADRLEEISRVEMHRWIDELEIFTKDLDKSRLEYIDLRSEVEVNLKHEDKQKVQEATRLINAAESRVRERERKVTDAINSLENAEVLLNRSMRIKAQQDVLLPLFRYLNVRFYP